jgi:hypothetical protein
VTSFLLGVLTGVVAIGIGLVVYDWCSSDWREIEEGRK